MGRFWCTTYRADWNNNTIDPKPWLVYDPCDMELFNAIAFGFALYANMLIFIYIKCISTRNPSPRRLLFNGHSARCTVNTIACLAEFALTVDYALSTCGSLVPATVGLLAQLSSGLVCYMLEVTGRPGPMGFGAIAWLVCGLSRALLFVSLTDAGFTVHEHVRLPTLALSAACCYAVAALHLYAMVGRSKINKTDLDLEFFTYKHDLCSWYSRITFYWLTGFLRNCYKHLIQLEDLGQLPNREKSTTQYGRLYDIYLKQKEMYGTSTKVSMWKCYCKAYWKEFLLGGILKMMGDFVGYIGPLGVSVIVNFVAKQHIVPDFTTNDETDSLCCVTFWAFVNNGYVMAFIMLVSCIAQGSFSQTSTHILNVEGIRLKSGLQAMLYCKMLKLQQTQLDSTSENGHIINLLSEDTTNIMSSFWIGHYIWAIPLKIIFLIFLLYLKLGWSAVIGSTCCIMIMIPLQFVIGKKMSSNSKEISHLSDKRLQLTNEVLQGIRLVKLCGWENEFVDRITDARNNELELLDKDSIYWGSMTFLTHASSVLVSLFCLGLYCLQNGSNLDSGAIFSSLALSNQLTVPLFIFPITVPIIIAAIVSTKRIEEFMSLPEITPNTNHKKSRTNKNNKRKQPTNVSWTESDTNISSNNLIENISEENDNTRQDTEPEVCVSIKDASFAWPNSKIPVLDIDNLKIEEGKLTIITGKVGSGKTSILLALLGEMDCLFGEIDFKRETTVAYVSQRTWLLNASVLENIVFGDQYNKSRFKKIIDACALGPDIDILPDRERTIIGERGIALSGGQQQRVAIARALYSKANIVLMDNPLSALDSDVSQHVLFNGIKKFTLNQIKTVIMTTSFASDLSFADTVILVEAGKIEFCGSLADLETRDVQNMMVKMENQDHGRRTATERWKLFKLVSKIGHQLYRNWPTVESQKKLKKNFGALYGSRYLTHDLLLPTDECGDGDSCIERNHWPSSDKKRERSATIADIQLPRRKPFIDETLVNQPAISFHSSIKYRNYPHEKQIQKSLRRHVLSSVGISHSSNRLRKMSQYSVKRKLRSDDDFSLTEEVLLKKMPSNVSDVSDDHTSADLKGERGRFEDEFIYNSVSLRTYFKYVAWSGWTTYVCYLIFTISWQTSRVFIDFWLSYWPNRDPLYETQTYWYLVVYSLLCMISIALSALSNTLGQYGALKARKLVHQRMLNNIILCPLSFFDATPIGRIDNCFSNDLVIIDKKIGTSMQRLVHFVFLCLCGIIVNAIITPWFLIILVPICLVYYTVQKFYRCSSRDLQKLEGNLRSPMITHCNETISGLDTIRAFGKQNWFMSEMINRIDNHTKVFLIISSSNRWLGIALDYLGGAIVFVATMVALITTTFFSTAISSAMVGLAINYTLLVPVYLNWVVKFFADLETYMSAVERTEEFATIPIENYRNETIITRAWPSKGYIFLDKISIKYNESQDPVISDVTLHIPPGQKVGICGRTGSGKSSLVMSILNMVPIRDGIIMIDGIDINNVPLQSLRSRISVIPQDVKMFGGTIRQNLDLKNEYSDTEIWSSLRMAQMEETVKLQLGGLEGIVTNSGDKLSSGQKQLLCLARAILQDNVCLIMDEPTSSVDDETEKKLLEAIKTSFNGRTVITIAHRLSTILDYDRVLILDGGKIIEDTTPSRIKTFPECL